MNWWQNWSNWMYEIVGRVGDIKLCPFWRKMSDHGRSLVRQDVPRRSRQSVSSVDEYYSGKIQSFLVVFIHSYWPFNFECFQCLRLPLSLKYDCTSQTTWRLAVHSLLHVLRLGLPVARLRPDNHDNNVQETMLPLWTEITLALDEFLFPKR